MVPSQDNKKLAPQTENADAPKQDGPEWTSGLKRLYDSVLDEPLPDSFKDLLSKLDENENG
ncbi:NepR family anti-sigma factor [Aurantiacibacter sp. D1-12]|uniref:NepR family anti-sigma factor n=1 Tax=Aurantiacibacter sp. D1-12 TaxID=2993658 RepID=UPI00237D0444|nr:NepR family anti-sigma factor [Aurantiacibacter sp. D1-12]MDE1467161.1 NepR family anti-sigma factor [Aurantiacibacter sp. D1-12]